MKKIVLLSKQKICLHADAFTGKPILLCVHGGMGLGSDSLIPSLQHLSTLFDLVFMDQRGHGDSEPAHDGNYFFESFSKDIKEVMDQLGGSEVRGIFGHSLGGMIAIQTMFEYPELFRFAILSNTALDSTWQVYANASLAKVDKNELDISLKRYQQNPSDSTLRELGITYAPIYFPELAFDKAKHEMWKFSYRDASTLFLSKNVYSKIDLKVAANSVSVPALVISGGKDEVIPSSCYQSLMAQLPNAKGVEMSGAGHFPFITKTQEFTKEISDWWNQVSHSV